MCQQLLVRAIIFLVLFIIFAIGVVISISKKKKGYKLEILIGSIVGIGALIIIILNFYRAFNPEIKTITMEYSKEYRSSVNLLEYDLYFKNNDEVVSLSMDIFTYRNIYKNMELAEGEEYIVTYEENEEMIISIEKG